MDLFDHKLAASKQHAPLGSRMRPKNLSDIVGQEHLLGASAPLRVLLEKDRLPSLIFWGPPGTGKTTLARTIADVTKSIFVPLSAVSAGVKEVREITAAARERLKLRSERTILFIDEIHRFNKGQQDALLPAVEEGIVVLIGATTENPSFEVNSALLSRTQVFVLRAHTKESLDDILRRTLADTENGLGGMNVMFDDDARQFLVDCANGDARILLNILESAVNLVPEEQGTFHITRKTISDAQGRKSLRYDAHGDEHYTVISAFIKSMRNSDADAALYWLARMIEAGEDPLFIARRCVTFASEDVGLADPQGLVLANAAFQAVHAIGMPEGRIILGHVTTYLSFAPKNNAAYRGIEAALSDVREYGNLPVPLHLRNASTALLKELDYGKGYQYAHDFESKKTDMPCLPEELIGKKYIDPQFLMP